MALNGLVASPWMVHALGWTLLHLCWQGAVVALLLWCVLGLLKSSRARYAAACLALLLMVACPLATLVQLAATQRGLNAQGGAVEAPGMTIHVGPKDAQGWMHGLDRMADELDRAVPWVLVAWFAGAVLFLVRLNVGLMLARRLRSMATEAVPQEMLEMFAGVRERLGVARPVRLLKSAMVQVPTVVGWLRPVVLVPVSCFTGLSQVQIEAVLCHELAHVMRHDYLVSVVQSVVEALLFYHPAVWWISRQIRRERECCCDDVAVAVGGDVLAYARALSFLEARRSFYPEVGLSANGGVLTMRIKRLLGYDGSKRSLAASQAVSLTVLTMVVGAAAASIGSMAHAEAGRASLVMPLVMPPGVPIALEKSAMLDAKIAVQSAPTLNGSGVRRVSLPAASELLVAGGVAGQQAAAPIASSQNPSPGGPLQVSGRVMAGNLLLKVDPIYPPDAKQAGIQGAVVMRATVSKEGTIKDLEVISGPDALRGSAFDAVSQWTYKPFLLNGQPIEVTTTITVNYTLAGRDDAEDGPNAASVRRIGNGVSAPVALSMPDPEYTEEARKAKMSGNVLVSMVVDTSGNPTRVHVVRGLGNGLDAKAIEAVRRYKFKPGMEHGETVPVQMNVEVNFQFF